MKKFGLVFVGAVLSVMAAFGATMSANNYMAKEVLADAGTFYYHGSDTSKSSTAWQGSSTHYFSNGVTYPSVGWTLNPGEKFKITNGSGADWGTEYNATIGGSAAGLFSGGYYDSFNDDIAYNGTVSATFTVTLDSGTIYFDYQDNAVFYYVGSDASKQGSAWTSWTDRPIYLNGTGNQFNFSTKEQFKLRPACDTSAWGGVLGSDYLSSNYYSCFGSSDGNIFVRYGATYYVTLTSSNHSLSISISVNNPESNTNTAYVLDLFNQKHPTKVHYFHKYRPAGEGSDWEIGTSWPGTALGDPTGRIYSYTYWNAFDKVVFNSNDGDYKTADLTAQSGKCFVLESRSDWSGQWIAIEAAEFIDNYMKFNSYNETQYKTEITANCDANWTAAQTAYNALGGADEELGNSLRLEVLKISVVAERLDWWAKAHGKTIDTSTGGKISAINLSSLAPLSGDADATSPLIIAVLSFVAVTAIGGFFVLKRKKTI